MTLGLITLIVSAMALVWGFVLTQIRWGWTALRMFREAEALPELPDEQLPNVAVVIGLRGSDPSLASAMQSLLSQDYPNYRVHVVIDSKNDPAWEKVNPLIDSIDTTRLDVSVLRNPPETCSLKIAGLIQGIRRSDDSSEVVVSVDSDMTLAEDWLRRLMRPFADPEVTVSGGIRWFHASAGGIGTLMRFCWNTFCVAWMTAYRTPWGGCMAVRKDFLFSSGLYNDLHHSMAEDLTVATNIKLNRSGKFAFAPFVGNSHETISLSSFLTYGRRQLMYANAHHTSWPVLFAMNVYCNLAYTVVQVAVIYHLITQQWAWALAEGITIAGYWIGLTIIQSLLDNRFGDQHKFSLRLMWQWAAAGVLTHCAQLDFTLFAPLRSRVLWRGIEYDVSRRGVKRLNYKPFVAEASAGSESVI